MTHAPLSRNIMKIPGSVKFFRVSAYITGILLLLLCVEMLFKYAFELELELGGPRGFLALVPTGSVTAVNLSTGLLIVHGWFYVIYLLASFRLWSLMRWPLLRFILIALGGIVPFLSFILERRIARDVSTHLAAHRSGTEIRTNSTSNGTTSNGSTA